VEEEVVVVAVVVAVAVAVVFNAQESEGIPIAF